MVIKNVEHLNSVHCLLSCMTGQNFTKRKMRPRKLTTLSNEPFLSALWLAPLSVMGLACFTWCQIETRCNSNTGKRKEAHYERVALATNTGHSLLYNQRQIYIVNITCQIAPRFVSSTPLCCLFTPFPPTEPPPPLMPPVVEVVPVVPTA